MRSRLREGEGGAAYVEFLIVVMPFLLLFLGLTQLGLIYGAQLLVEHAAAKAVRAAVVVLPDDHEEADYAGVPVNTVGAATLQGALAYQSAPSGGRLAAIRDAARFVLAPAAPSLDGYAADSVAEAIGDGGVASSVVGMLGWNEWAVAVTFPDGEGGLRTSFDPRGEVTARVTFLFRCNVPMARSVMCSRFGDLPTDRKRALTLNGSFLGNISGVAGWQVLALEAERTMPNQGR